MNDKLNKRIAAIEKVKSQQFLIKDSVRALRRSVNLTQTEFAQLIKIAPRVLMEIERGRGNPTLETLNKIADAFGFRVGFVEKR